MVDGRETSQTKVLAGVKPSRAVTPMAPWHSGTWGGMLLPWERPVSSVEMTTVQEACDPVTTVWPSRRPLWHLENLSLFTLMSVIGPLETCIPLGPHSSAVPHLLLLVTPLSESLRVPVLPPTGHC